MAWANNQIVLTVDFVFTSFTRPAFHADDAFKTTGVELSGGGVIAVNNNKGK